MNVLWWISCAQLKNFDDDLRDIYIYFDICTEQLIGGSRGSLVRFTTVDKGQCQMEKFNYPYYVNVKPMNTNQLEVYIKDRNGKDASFLTETTTCTFHLRKIIIIMAHRLVPYIQDSNKWVNHYMAQAMKQAKRKELTKEYKDEEIKPTIVLPTMQMVAQAESEMRHERDISFTLGKARFLDSLNFMNEGLSKLVDNLAAEGDQHFHHIKNHFSDPNHRKLLLRKGVYPYEWMDSMEKMQHTALPSKESFYSTLTLSHYF